MCLLLTVFVRDVFVTVFLFFFLFSFSLSVRCACFVRDVLVTDCFCPRRACYLLFLSEMCLLLTILSGMCLLLTDFVRDGLVTD